MALTSSTSQTRDQLISGLKMVVEEAQKLLSNSGDVSEGMSMAKDRISSTLKTAQSGLSTAQDTALQTTRNVAKVTDSYVTSNPWKTVGIGALAGIAIGLMLGRR